MHRTAWTRSQLGMKGIRVLGVFRVSGFGFRVEALGFRVQGLRFRAQGFGFRAQGVEYKRVFPRKRTSLAPNSPEMWRVAVYGVRTREFVPPSPPPVLSQKV